MIKKLILIALIAIVSIQLAMAPNNLPTESISAKLSFGNVELPTGTVTGYNLTMQGDAIISIMGVDSKAVYFVVGEDSLFYRKTREDNVQSFDVPLDEELGLRVTAVTEDASEVVINRLPYKFAYGDRLGFNLNLNYDGSLYGILFGRQRSDNSIAIDGVSGKALFLYNDNAGNIALLTENDELSSFGLSVSKTVTFRAPIIAGGHGDETAEARRIERAGAIAEALEGEGCTDVDTGANEYSTSSYGYDQSGIFLSDFCATDPRVGRKVLNEVKCNADGNAYLEEHECTGVCRNGACTATEGGQVAFCYDSDTRGEATDLNYNKITDMAKTKGVVAGFYAAGRDISYGLWDDSCSSDKKLVEYSCKNSRVRFFTINCLSGCSDRKCIEPPYCFDTDGGNNANAKGKVIYSRLNPQGSVTGNVENDACSNATALKEKVCSEVPGNSTWENVIVNCPNGCRDGRCLKEGEEAEKACTSRNDCNFSQACINGQCGKCTKSQDCGSGWVCSSPDKRCKPSSGKCKTDLNCKIGKYCKPKQGEELGFCEDERLNNLTDIGDALARRWKRVNAYARIITRFEQLHNLPLPQPKANGQACFVDEECTSRICDPDTNKCIRLAIIATNIAATTKKPAATIITPTQSAINSPAPLTPNVAL